MDLTWIDDVMLLRRAGRRPGLVEARPGSVRRAVSASLSDLFINGEGGLMGMVADQPEASGKRFYDLLRLPLGQ